MPAYWIVSVLTLLLPLALLPIVLVWLWRALRRLDAAQLADRTESAAEERGADRHREERPRPAQE
jgi:hypothetical protein